MSNLKVSIELDIQNQLSKTVINRIKPPITSAANTVANELKSRGRENIRKSYKNMSRLANTFKVTVIPKGKQSYHPAILARVSTGSKNKAGYSKVFEDGATIRGRPYLWIPLPNTRKLMGAKSISPRDWSNKYGELVSIRSGGKLLLIGKYGLNQKAAGSKGRRRLVGTKRLGSKSQGQMTPLFVGVRSVSISPQWGLRQIASQEARKLRDLIKRNVARNG